MYRPRWVRTDPSRFRAGQTVQLEVAFRVVPTAAKHLYRMVPLIRSIALLDSDLYTVSTIRLGRTRRGPLTVTQAWQHSIRIPRSISSGRVQVKRSTAYYTEDESPFAPRPSKRARRELTANYGEDEDGPSASTSKSGDDQMAFAGEEYDDM